MNQNYSKWLLPAAMPEGLSLRAVWEDSRCRFTLKNVPSKPLGTFKGKVLYPALPPHSAKVLIASKI